MKAARSSRNSGGTSTRRVRTRQRVASSRKPSFALSFLAEALDSRLVFTRASTGVRFNVAGIPEAIAQNLPRFDYDPASMTGYNLLANSQWAGGGTNVAPTGWTRPAAGTHTPNGAVNGSVVIRFTAAAQRPFIQTTVPLTLAVGDVRINSIYVGTIYSGSVVLSNMVNWVNAGGAGTQTWYIDGVENTTPDQTTVTANTRVSVRIVCTTAGTLQPRGGPGVGATCTVDMDCSRPAVHAAWLPLAYYMTSPGSAASDAVLRGLLMEEARTNLLSTSEVSDWTNNTPNTARGGWFFGTYNGTMLINGSVSGDSPYKPCPSGTLPAAGGAVTGSMLLDFATAGSPTVNISLLIFDADGVQYVRGAITIATGVMTTTSSGANVTISRAVCRKVFGSVWFVALGGTFAKVSTSPPRLYCQATGTGTTQIVAGCPQIEVGAFETSYIPTTNAQATRATDDLYVLNTNIPGYRNDIGTWYFEGYQHPVVAVARIAINTSNTTAERRSLYANANWTVITNSGGAGPTVQAGASSAGAIGRAAFSYAATGVSIASDGAAPNAAVLAQPTASDRVRFGGFTGAAMWNAPMRVIRYWPRAIAGAELQARSVAG